MTVSVIVLGIAVALLGVLVVGLLRSHAEVLRRLHELGAGVYEEDLPDGRSASPLPSRPAGPDIRTRDGVAPPRGSDTPAHDVAGVSPGGEAVAVGVTGAPHPTLLAFLTTGCATCAGFWAAFADGVAHDLPEVGGEGTRLVVITRGAEQESPAEVHRLAPPGVTTVMSTQAFDDYAVPVNPYFILVDGPGERVVGEGAAATWEQVAGLLGRAAADQGYGTGPLADGMDDPGEIDAFEEFEESEEFEEFEEFDDPDSVIDLRDDTVVAPDADAPPGEVAAGVVEYYDDYPGYEQGDDEDGLEDFDGFETPFETPVDAVEVEEVSRHESPAGTWMLPEEARIGRDSRQRDALAEAELFVAGIGPGHPSLYPDRLQDDPVIATAGFDSSDDTDH